MIQKYKGAVGMLILGMLTGAVLGAVFFVAKGTVLAQGESIEQKLSDKSSRERANLKALEIVRRNSLGTYQDPAYGLRIEIQSVSKIEGGVEIFARAWKGANQLGFGSDGSVEIERFRIFNPPVLVPDPNGTVVREYTDKLTGELKQEKFREDLVEAPRKSLAHTISIVGKDGAGIVPGKRGNTTSTFYPDAHPESTSVDGYSGFDDADTGGMTWSQVRDAATGGRAADTVATGDWLAATGKSGGGNFRSLRGFFLFDTSALGSATVDSATFSVYVSSTLNGDNDGNDFGTVVGSTPASNTAITTADYDQIASTEYIDSGQRKDISSITTGQYLDFTFNATGRSNVVNGITKLAMREGHDFLNDEPGAAGNNYILGSHADAAGTTNDPKLVVVHYAAAPTGARKTATETTSSDTTINGDMDLGLALAANKVYDIHGVIFASSTSQDPDIKVAFTVPSGAEMDIAVIPSSSDQAGLLQTSGTATYVIPIPAPDPVVIEIMGTVKTGGTSGTLIFQWAQNQSDTAAVGVLRGSYLRASEI